MDHRLSQAPARPSRKRIEIVATIATLKATPHKGSLSDEIVRGLVRAPADWNAFDGFLVDDDGSKVLNFWPLLVARLGSGETEPATVSWADMDSKRTFDMRRSIRQRGHIG